MLRMASLWDDLPRNDWAESGADGIKAMTAWIARGTRVATLAVTAAAATHAVLIVTISTAASACRSDAAPAKHADIAYADNGHCLQVLDLYTPLPAPSQPVPVMFWIHGGAWERGDKADVAIKPRALTERGFVFVSTNYRLLPAATMEDVVADVAKSLGWVYRHVAKYGGDPSRIVVAGHSAGAQLAALLCTDDRYLAKEAVPFTALVGCVPVDGDTYDIPKIILTTEHRHALYGLPMPTFGHRQKFGNDPGKHMLFSAVSHIASGKHIPPFLVLYASSPDTRAQSHHLESILQGAGVRARAIGNSNTTHTRLNDDLGNPDDPATGELFTFLSDITATMTCPH